MEGSPARALLACAPLQNPNVKLTVFGDYFVTNMDCAELINRFGTSDVCKQDVYVTNLPSALSDSCKGLSEKICSPAWWLMAPPISPWQCMCIIPATGASGNYQVSKKDLSVQFPR